MKNKNKYLFLIFILFFASAVFAGEDVKTLFDRYQALYSRYREAISAQADPQAVSSILVELQAASKAYYKSIGKLAYYSDPDSAVPSVIDIKSADATGQTGQKSTLQRQYDGIVAEMSLPSSDLNYDKIRAMLEDFITNCTDEKLKKEAYLNLADVVYQQTKSLSQTQTVLLNYARTVQNSEYRRQAMATIRVYKKLSVVDQKRKEYQEIVDSTVNKYGKFAKTSWFAFPVKLVNFGSYGINNIKRIAKARELDKALEEYNVAVLDTYEPGSTEALTRSKLVPLNKIKLLANGRSSFARRLALGQSAQSSLYLQTLLFNDDEIGNALTDVMCERAEAGVDVRLILDDAFSFGKKDGCIQRLKNAGVKVLINNPILKNLLKANFRSHQKLFIVDETYAVVGGMNIGDEYAKGEIEEYGWRDTDVEVQGPLVRSILDLFEQNWEDLTLKKWNEVGDYAKKKEAHEKVNSFKPLKNVDKLIRGPIPVYFEEPPVFEDVNARFITTFPIDDKDDNVLDLFEIYLNMAEKEVIFESAYFIPTDRLVKAIADAVARGVEVKIITNSIESNNHPSGGWAGRYAYERVLNVGARIFEWRGAQTLHSKVSLFDDFAVTLGAYNVNSRSHTSDSEDIVALEDYRLAKVFKVMLEKDLSRCNEITLQDFESWDKSFMKKSKMEFFNMFKFLF
ncbi:MAG: phosphatidylserine/phosphatidylglycerophosphate/cardiolipin synthase family protein [Candidatus Riflebacteria bacterium]|jgi:cardiolipin synthase|nr:phosphatidylserine/phosphatidylglycerophosphate/cardiolipin synthase family protein [Candidatus Riflebacteria bacterium]